MTLITTPSRLIIWLLGVSMLFWFLCLLEQSLILCTLPKTKVRAVTNEHRRSSKPIKTLSKYVADKKRGKTSVNQLRLVLVLLLKLNEKEARTLEDFSTDYR